MIEIISPIYKAFCDLKGANQNTGSMKSFTPFYGWPLLTPQVDIFKFVEGKFDKAYSIHSSSFGADVCACSCVSRTICKHIKWYLYPGLLKNKKHMPSVAVVIEAMKSILDRLDDEISKDFVEPLQEISRKIGKSKDKHTEVRFFSISAKRTKEEMFSRFSVSYAMEINVHGVECVIRFDN